MFCAALTTKGEPCKNGVRSGCTIVVPARFGTVRIYHTCLTHKNSTNLNIKRSTIAPNPNITHNQARQETLPMDIPRNIRLSIRPVIHYEITERGTYKFQCTPATFLDVANMQEFKAMAYDELEQNPGLEGMTARNGGTIYLVTREKAVRLTKSSNFINVNLNHEEY